MKTRVLLVAENGLAREAYMDVLRDVDVDVDCIASPDDMTGALIDANYSGLLVDVPTMIRSESSHKNRLTRIMNRFPVLRLMFNSDFGGIRGLAQGGTIKDNRDLGDFILHECVPFNPRSIRVAQRKEVVFNVKLLNDLEREDRAELTVTVNLSEQGCFVYSVNDWQLDSSAWMVISELEDTTPIELKVCWKKSWGDSMTMPGIGARFESMTTHQYVQIHSFL